MAEFHPSMTTLGPKNYLAPHQNAMTSEAGVMDPHCTDEDLRLRAEASGPLLTPSCSCQGSCHTQIHKITCPQASVEGQPVAGTGGADTRSCLSWGPPHTDAGTRTRCKSSTAPITPGNSSREGRSEKQGEAATHKGCPEASHPWSLILPGLWWAVQTMHLRVIPHPGASEPGHLPTNSPPASAENCP